MHEFFKRKILEIKDKLDDPGDLYIQPFDVNDFDRRKIYYAKWKCDDGCQKQHGHYEYKPCFIIFLADDENSITFMEQSSRNKIPTVFYGNESHNQSALTQTRPTFNSRTSNENKKRKVAMSRGQSILSLLSKKKLSFKNLMMIYQMKQIMMIKAYKTNVKILIRRN
ncbi:uncharacterized protein LOC116416270 [Nasonia vitripennis]|uniref:Uncharacterized protein n=1 Tax=Nasonia vitripennis TaxID=7425 RepID=A0A7M7T7E0_NASVI|nr:uncharacterized protein LOC116416270 [Nasonia vitripennis]